MGFRDFFKRNRKEVIRENQSQGKSGEEYIKRKYENEGYKVTRTGRGHDWKAERKEWWTGKKESKVIEVKTGNSPLSDLQKKKKRQYGSKYVVERLEPTPFGLIPNNNSSESKARKKSFWHGSSFDSSRYSKPSRPRSANGFGSGLNDMFGSGSSKSSKPRRRKSDGLNDMFGF